MSLLDRLKAAQAAREGAAKGSGDAIDLRESEAATPEGEAEAESAPRKPIWGRPTRCPACNSPGYLDRIDLVNRVMFQHCTNCRHRWETPESETIRATTS